ncbi:hypothetical protein K474DRAFT_1658350 [Panus rudis PR-1116 ss-1]|nr:hypothetical protein K474DRAFT_1658350 [Panus rudis PR-1116 ss-1]
MPKITDSSTKLSRLTSKDKNPHVLKRNQACHQCRKRKMKCDAKRPCAGCVRSHAYAVAHAPNAAEIPPHPECTFDEGAEFIEDDEDDEDRYSKERFLALESRLRELEALLQLREQGIQSTYPVQPLQFASTPYYQEISQRPDHLIEAPPLVDAISNDGTSSHGSYGADASGIYSLASTSEPDFSEQSSSSASFIRPLEPSIPFPGLVNNSWPANLPPLGLTRRLAEACFTFNQTRHYLHQPTFMNNLSLPSTHPDFPSTSLLHAVCAIGSRYIAASATTPFQLQQFLDQENCEPFHLTNFADEQVMLAKTLLEENCRTGTSDFLQHIQASILLTWYYWFNARWLDAYTFAGKTIRVAVSMGLNVAQPSPSIRGPTTKVNVPLMNPSITLLEEESRRNAFWAAYTLERSFGSANGWALSLDDEDIYQKLPLRLDCFESGITATDDSRQWSTDDSIFLTHPEEHTDSFVIYVKSVILLSKAKALMHRLRPQFVAEVLEGPANTSPNQRKDPEFEKLQHIATSFRDSLPPTYRQPIVGDVVDPHLYSALCIPHLVRIIMHEPFAMVGWSSCVSACHLIEAARGILNLLHAIRSTSYDQTKLGLFPLYAWFTSGRILTRFLAAAQEAKSDEQTQQLEAEIAFVITAIHQIGDLIPLACRYARLLDDFVKQMCGVDTYRKLESMVVLNEPLRDDHTHPTNLQELPELLESDEADVLLKLREALLEDVAVRNRADMAALTIQSHAQDAPSNVLAS